MLIRTNPVSISKPTGASETRAKRATVWIERLSATPSRPGNSASPFDSGPAGWFAWMAAPSGLATTDEWATASLAGGT